MTIRKLIILSLLLVSINHINICYASQKLGNKEYDEVICTNVKCDPAIIKNKGKYGVLNKINGEYKAILPIEYDKITKTPDSSYKHFIVVKKGKYGLFAINYNYGKFIFPAEYDNIKNINNARAFILKRGNKYAIYNFEEEKLSEYYDEIIETKQGSYYYLLTKKNNKYGIEYISGANKDFKLKCEYDSIEPLNYHNIFKLEKDNKYAIYNAQTKTSTDFIFDKTTTTITTNGGQYFIINEKGKYSFYKTNSFKSKFIIKNCDEITSLKHGWDLYKIKKGNKYALYRSSVSAFIYDDIQDGDNRQFILVKKNNKWNKINVTGEERAVASIYCLFTGDSRCRK